MWYERTYTCVHDQATHALVFVTHVDTDTRTSDLLSRAFGSDKPGVSCDPLEEFWDYKKKTNGGE